LRMCLFEVSSMSFPNVLHSPAIPTPNRCICLERGGGWRCVRERCMEGGRRRELFPHECPSISFPCARVCARAHTHTHIDTRLHTHTHTQHAHTQTHIDTHRNTHTHTHTHTHSAQKDTHPPQPSGSHLTRPLSIRDSKPRGTPPLPPPPLLRVPHEVAA
jgi:hypothetical protein